MELMVCDRKTIERGIVMPGRYVVISIHDADQPRAKVKPQPGLRDVLFLVPCSSHNYGLTEGQRVVGAKRGGLRMDAYVDDERQSPRPLGPRPKGWP